MRYVTVTKGSGLQEEELLTEVNDFLIDIQNIQEFDGSWMLIAQWDKVHPHPHGADDHEGISEKFLNKVWLPYKLICRKM